MSLGFDLDSAISKWLKKFRKHQAFSDGMVRELEVHIKDHIDDLISSGYSDQEAFRIAVSQFGDLQLMAKEEYRNLRPGISSNSRINTTMLFNYLKIGLRNFWHQKFYTLINIFGLTMGFTIVFLIALFVDDELSFDRFNENKDELYRVVENQYYADQPVFPVAVTPTAIGPALQENFAEVVNFTRFQAGDYYRFRVDGQAFLEKGGAVADANFFKMFSYQIVKGSVEGFKENLNAVVINQELAEKYFPNSDLIGKTLNIGTIERQIVAVIENVPDNSHLDFRYILNFEKYLAEDPERAESWGNNWLYTYVQLQKEADPEAVNAKIKDIIKKNNEGSVTDVYLQPLLDIYLGETDFVVEVSRKSQMMYVKLFSIVAVFILVISCINFLNLATARGAKRAKEVGLRKTIGANRGQLIWQFMSESTLLTIISVLLSLGTIILLLPVFNLLVDKQFSFDTLIHSQYASTYLMLIIGTVIFTGILAGSYPALYLSAMNPIVNLSNQQTKGKKGSRFRQVLVVFQFAISVVLIIGTIVIYKQLRYIQNVDLGYNKENIMYSFIPGDKASEFVSEMKKETSVLDAGLANQHPAYIMNSTSGFSWSGKNPDDVLLFHIMGCDENYMQTMEMTILQGRGFIEADTASIIINEKALELMGFDEPIGEIVSLGSEEYKIVGIVKNFNFKSIHTPIEPIIIAKLPSVNRIFVRYQPGNEEAVVAAAKNQWQKRFPDRDFDYYFLEDDFSELYHAEQRTSTLASYFAGFAILISCLGLFGLVSYAAEQRTKEVGIRKVLGASVNNLFLLLTGDFTRLILISLLFALPVGWYVMKEWLDNFAFRIDLTPDIFIIASIAAIVIALLTVSYQTLKVSVNNPVNALRSE